MNPTLTQPTKHCPHCKQEINFLTFLTNYGSDTLIPGKMKNGQVHPREHVCKFCHKKFWIHYRRRKFQVVSRKYLNYLILTPLVGWFLGRVILHLPMEQSVGLAGVLFFIVLPFYASFVKYQGIELKPD